MSVYAKDTPDFFKMALESVTSHQIVKPKQVVIVKDGPVFSQIDAIVDEIKNENPSIDFCVVGTETNNGLASALNYGLKYVETDWVARMDSDDISVSERFKLQTEFLEANPNVCLLGGFTEEFNETPGDLKRKREVPIVNNDIVTVLQKRNPINHPTVFMKKQNVIDVGGYSTECGKLEDYKLWVDMFLAGCEFYNLDTVLVNMRVGNGFIERRNNRNEIKDWDKLQKYMRKKKMISPIRKIINKTNIRLFIYSPKWLKRFLYNTILRSNKE